MNARGITLIPLSEKPKLYRVIASSSH
jgi:hypothetical protein